jgi:hypothetical protein
MRRFFWVAAIGAAALVTGSCTEAPANIREANWENLRSSDISCIGGVHVTADYYDLNGDGHDEAFLTMRCTARTDPPGDQLEVVAGGADLATTHPTKLVLQMPRATVDRLCFTGGAAVYRVTVAGESKVWQVRWPADAAKPGVPIPGPPRGCP